MAPFPRLDPPWPDGDVTDLWSIGDDDHDPGLEPEVRFPDPGPSWSEPWSGPTPCRGPRRQVRPLHCRRSRHSFEPEDLSDADLDRLLRGASPDPPGGHLSAEGWSWPAWAKFALATGVLLVVVGVVGVLTAAGDTGDNPDTITTRGQSRPNRPNRPPPTTTTAAHPGAAEEEPPALPPTSSPSPPPTAAPQQPTATVPTLPPPVPSSGAFALPDRAADAASMTTAGPCHPSYEPCVPVAEDVDCAGDQGNGPAYLDHAVQVTGPDVYGLDGDDDDQACE